jgi:hypothetical protein
LLTNEKGSSSISYLSTWSNSDGFDVLGTVTLAHSGLYWVRVSNGRVDSNVYWSSSNMNGFALYDYDTWVNADNGYKNGTLLLSAPDAPEPLLFLPAGGSRDIGNGLSYGFTSGYYWCTTQQYYNYVYAFTRFLLQNQKVESGNQIHPGYGVSVRCIEAVDGTVQVKN